MPHRDNTLILPAMLSTIYLRVGLSRQIFFGHRKRKPMCGLQLRFIELLNMILNMCIKQRESLEMYQWTWAIIYSFSLIIILIHTQMLHNVGDNGLHIWISTYYFVHFFTRKVESWTLTELKPFISLFTFFSATLESEAPSDVKIYSTKTLSLEAKYQNRDFFVSARNFFLLLRSCYFHNFSICTLMEMTTGCCNWQ